MGTKKQNVKSDVITEKDVIIRPIKNSVENSDNIHLDGFKNPTNEIPTNVVFQANKVTELVNIYNEKRNAKTINLFATIDSKNNLKTYTDKGLKNTYDTKDDNGFITYNVTYKTNNIDILICLTTKGKCIEPRKKQNRRQYIMFVETKKTSLTDDMTSGFNARLKAVLKSKGIIK